MKKLDDSPLVSNHYSFPRLGLFQLCTGAAAEGGHEAKPGRLQDAGASLGGAKANTASPKRVVVFFVWETPYLSKATSLGVMVDINTI